MAKKSDQFIEKPETDTERCERLRGELTALNRRGREMQNTMQVSYTGVLCRTRHAMQLTRKMANHYRGFELSIIVVGEVFDDTVFEVRGRPVYNEPEPIGSGQSHQLAQEINQAKNRINALAELPTFAQMQLYMQGAADMIAETEALRKELESAKKRASEDGRYDRRMMMMPMFYGM